MDDDAITVIDKDQLLTDLQENVFDVHHCTYEYWLHMYSDDAFDTDNPQITKEEFIKVRDEYVATYGEL